MSDSIPDDLIIEATELYDEAEEALVQMDKGESFSDNFNCIFRAFHSVKGAAGMFGLEVLQAHMHHLENYLERVKDFEAIPSLMIDYFLNGIDAAKKLLHGESLVFDVKELDELLGSEATAPAAPATTGPAAPEQKKTEEVKVAPVKEVPEKEKEPKREMKKIEALAAQNEAVPQEKKKKVVRKKLVYVVDDEKTILNYFDTLLSDEGYEVVAFEDPAKMLEKMNSLTAPDAILSDFKMPEMNGNELMEKVRNKYPLLPIILISGYITKEVALDAVASGVEAILEKPVQEPQLLHSLKNATDRYRAIKILNQSIDLIMYQFADLDNYLQEKGLENVREKIKGELKVILDEKRKILS